jgi:hypothetical protein
MLDAPMQSLRVANALRERVGMLSNAGALDGQGVELRIGEAQSLYPEIWRHLDEARNALHAQGRDVSQYDTLRSEEGVSLGADIEAKRVYVPGKGTLGKLIDDAKADARSDDERLVLAVADAALGAGLGEVKVAHINVDGLRRADHARQALERAMPEIDWASVAAHEAAEVRRVGSLSSLRPILRVAGIVLVLAGIVVALYYLVLRTPSDDPQDAQPSAIHRRVRELERIERRHPCDPATTNELSPLLVLDHQPATWTSLRKRCKLP